MKLIGTILLGGISFLFLIGWLTWGPEELSSYKLALLGLIASVGVGALAFFISGQVNVTGDLTSTRELTSDSIGSPQVKVRIVAAGGIALLLIVLIIWTYGPTAREETPAKSSTDSLVVPTNVTNNTSTTINNYTTPLGAKESAANPSKNASPPLRPPTSNPTPPITPKTLCFKAQVTAPQHAMGLEGAAINIAALGLQATSDVNGFVCLCSTKLRDPRSRVLARAEKSGFKPWSLYVTLSDTMADQHMSSIRLQPLAAIIQ